MSNVKKADALAKSLRSTLGEAVRVARPEKCAELRISGLGDTASKEAVARMVAAEGGCTIEAVKVGEVNRPPGRQGTAWVKCPDAAAKKRTDGRRLSVEWAAV